MKKQDYKEPRNKLVLAIKIIIASAAIIFLPIGDYLMCCCFVLPPSYQTVRKLHPHFFNRFTALFICNGMLGACIAAAFCAGIDIEGITVGLIIITAVLWAGLSHSEFRWTNFAHTQNKESGRTRSMAQKDDIMHESTIVVISNFNARIK